MGGVYTDPYAATRNGASSLDICDDFLDYTYVDESWIADGIRPTFLSLIHSQPKAGYEVAWLATQLLSAPDKTTAGEIHLALWAVFDPAALDSSHGADSTDANRRLANAIGHADDSHYRPQPTIYSPIGTYNPPRELVVATPESSELALIVVDLSGAGLLFLLFRRRRAGRA